MPFQPGANLNTTGFGNRPENVEVPHYDTRVPSTTDILYPIGKRWIVQSTDSEYVLTSQAVSAGITTSTWTLLGTNSGALNTLTGDAGGAISPAAGNINLLGTAAEIETTGAGSTITFAIADPFNIPGDVVIPGTLDVSGLTTLAALTQVGTASINASGAATTTIGSTGAGGAASLSSAGLITIASARNNAQAILISASAGGIDMTAVGTAGEDIDITATGSSVNVNATEDAALAIYLHADGGTSETIRIHSDQGTGVGSVNVLSDVGGITLTATGLASADAINLEATAGGIDVDAALQINIASSQNAVDAIRIVSSAGGIDIDAVGAATEDINITNTGGSIVLVATENVTDAIVIQASGAAGGIDLIAGTNHVSVTGNLNFVTSGNKILSANVGSTSAAGANSFGTVTLVNGTVTVATTAVTASSIVILTRQTVGTTGANDLGILSVGTIVAGTSFDINAWTVTNATALQADDQSVIGWMIIN